MQKWEQFLHYVHVKVNDVFPDIDPPKLYVGQSTLPGIPANSNRGLFTRQFIPAGTPLMTVNLTETCLMNDAMVNLTAVLAAADNISMYEALIQLHTHYYDDPASKVNVVMATDTHNRVMYCAKIDIPADTELVRMYGFETWISELLPLMGPDTIAGFATFVKEYCATNTIVMEKVKVVARTITKSWCSV